jgi:hypothetical protein
MTEPRRHRRPPASLVFWGSVLLFTVLFALLTYRLEEEGSARQTVRAVQVRKVIKRRVVTTIVPGSGGSAVSSGPVSSSSSLAAGSEPVVTSAS